MCKIAIFKENRKIQMNQNCNLRQIYKVKAVKNIDIIKKELESYFYKIV